jgi:peptidoglycan/xylan/chitin deacetylase (PgdA/CDA1 family)
MATLADISTQTPLIIAFDRKGLSIFALDGTLATCLAAALAVVSITICIWFGVPQVARCLHTRGVQRLCRRKKLIALTFDDGPDKDLTPRILDLLDELEVKATFFMIGAMARENEELARQVASRGHLIAGHTEDHLDAWRTGPFRAMKDCATGIKTMSDRELPVSWFRPPKGHATLGTMLSCWLRSCRIIWWTHDSGDTGFGSRKLGFNPGRVVQRVFRSGRSMKTIEENTLPENRADFLISVENEGGVILLHDGKRSHQDYKVMTLDCTREIVSRAESAGFEFVTLDELR